MQNPNFDTSTSIQNIEFHERSSSVKKNVKPVVLHIETNIDKKKVDEHCHVQKNDKTRNKTVWRKLITVLILCIFFMIGEIVGGILAHSISIQTDAAHMAADIAGFFFSIMAIYISSKGTFICNYLRNFLTFILSYCYMLMSSSN